jgi:ferredoxin--NADP+ reductase
MREDIVLREVQVENQKEIAPDVYILSFRRHFDFKAGQVVAVSVNSSIPPRIYSIASGENEDAVDILYDVKHDGTLTPVFQKLTQGDKIFVSQPYGSFTDDGSPAHLIATGTGIAPFIAMIKSGNSSNKKLIHGARSEDYFYYSNLLLNELGERYIRCCSQCSTSENYAGRLTKYLSEQSRLPVDEKYYLCGIAEMVVEVRDILIAKNIPYHQIISEIYF